MRRVDVLEGRPVCCIETPGGASPGATFCAATCEAPNATVCGKEEDCPAKDVDGVPLIECAPEMGAYVQGTYGLCRYPGL